MPSLTAQQVKAATAGERPRKMFDGSGGLYLFVSPTGAKTWRLQYRINGRQKQRSLGAWPAVGLAEAREKAQALRQQVKAGEDPQPTRARVSRAPAFDAVAAEYWRGRADVSASYRANAERAVAMHLSPGIGAAPIDEIDRERLMAPLRRMDRAGKHVYVRKTRMWAQQVFDYAIEQGYCRDNPAAAINPKKAFGKARVESFAAVELAEVGALLKRLSLEHDIQSVRACRLLALTWLRTTELRNLRWTDIAAGPDGEPMILIPAGRMKRARDHLVPLSTQAAAILDAQRAVTGLYERIFIGGRTHQRPMSENAVLALLARIGYQGRMTGHGWRSIGSTWANEQGWNPDAIEAQLAHVPANRTRAAYNRAQYFDIRRRMLQAFADWLDREAARG